MSSEHTDCVNEKTSEKIYDTAGTESSSWPGSSQQSPKITRVCLGKRGLNCSVWLVTLKRYRWEKLWFSYIIKFLQALHDLHVSEGTVLSNDKWLINSVCKLHSMSTRKSSLVYWKKVTKTGTWYVFIILVSYRLLHRQTWWLVEINKEAAGTD